MNKIVIFPPDGKNITFINVKHYNVDRGVITIMTKDNFKYIITLPFMLEEKKDDPVPT